jgi:hypothetical protein
MNKKIILLLLIFNLHSYNFKFLNKENIKTHPYISSAFGTTALIAIVLGVDLFFEKYTKYNAGLFNKIFFKKLEFTEENLNNNFFLKKNYEYYNENLYNTVKQNEGKNIKIFKTTFENLRSHTINLENYYAKFIENNDKDKRYNILLIKNKELDDYSIIVSNYKNDMNDKNYMESNYNNDMNDKDYMEFDYLKILIKNKKTNKYETPNKLAKLFIKNYFKIDINNNLTQKEFIFNETKNEYFEKIEIEENYTHQQMQESKF